MTLRGKLLVAQVPLALALVLVGAVSKRTINQLDASSQDILKDNELSVLAAQHMRDAVDELGRLALARAVDGDATPATPPSGDAVRAASARFEHDLAFQQSNITEPGEREMTGRLASAWRDFLASDAGALTDGVAGAGADERLARYRRVIEPKVVAVERATDDIAAVNQDAMTRKSDLARQRGDRFSTVMVAVTLGACLLGLLASAARTTRLVRPLQVLERAVRRVAGGDLDARARLDGEDEIAKVALAFNALAERLADYRKSSLGELLQAQRSAQATIDSLRDPVIILQLDGRVANANQEAEALLGVRTDDAGDPFAKVDAGARDLIVRLREHVAAGNGPWLPKGLEESLPLPTPDGERWFLPRANPVHDDLGVVVAVTVILQDVTRLRRAGELEKDLVATVAHEFRTPLTSLRMAVHLCLEEAVGPLTAKQAELLTAARDDCERLQGIVSDLLDLSRISAGKIELRLRPVSSRALALGAVEDARAEAADRHVTLEVDARLLERATSPAVLADPDRAQLVFTNLIGNALRHTPSGGRVTVAARRDDAARAVRFEVSDTGPGIAREHQPLLFQRFARVPGSRTGGAGLGLYICKEIVAAHGGTIGVVSDGRSGSSFWFTLPCPDDAASAADSNIDSTLSTS